MIQDGLNIFITLQLKLVTHYPFSEETSNQITNNLKNSLFLISTTAT